MKFYTDPSSWPEEASDIESEDLHNNAGAVSSRRDAGHALNGGDPGRRAENHRSHPGNALAGLSGGHGDRLNCRPAALHEADDFHAKSTTAREVPVSSSGGPVERGPLVGISAEVGDDCADLGV